MLRFLIKRLLLAVLTLFVISASVFVLFFLGPANPAELLCGNKQCTPQQIARVNEAMEFDRPPAVQYAAYMRGIFAGRDIGVEGEKIRCPAPCLGLNFRTSEPVTNMIARSLPVTLSIVLGGSLLYVTIGTCVGMFSALRRGTLFDRGATGLTLIFGSMQIFFLGPLLMLLLVYNWDLLPRPQYTPLLDNPLKWAGGMLLPWITLGLISSATYARLSRAQMIETLSEDFVRTAQAKGLTRRQISFRHALRAAINPIVTVAGLEIGGNLGGVVITETTFSLQGLGRTSLRAVFEQNLSVVMAVVMISAIFVVVSNIVVDIVYAIIDPRVRLGGPTR